MSAEKWRNGLTRWENVVVFVLIIGGAVAAVVWR